RRCRKSIPREDWGNKYSNSCTLTTGTRKILDGDLQLQLWALQRTILNLQIRNLTLRNQPQCDEHGHYIWKTLPQDFQSNLQKHELSAGTYGPHTSTGQLKHEMFFVWTRKYKETPTPSITCHYLTGWEVRSVGTHTDRHLAVHHSTPACTSCRILKGVIDGDYKHNLKMYLLKRYHCYVYFNTNSL
uniref:Uncharacterized protein n=1 Tax=Parascaris univalens TaxID=6257 RepID=A0A915B5K4_PARUN